nr:DUF3857 domain-containing protein [uncultured Flavobacterium sp.]
MKIKIAVVIFLFLSTQAKAQNYELGKVTTAELQEKANPKDTAAPATILFKKARTFFSYNIKSGFTVNHAYEFKIKIYKKEGLSWADQKVRFYVGYESINKDRLEFSDAATYNLENGKVVKTKLDSQGSFKNSVNKYWNEKTITLPNVKVGAIIEFKYVLKSENIVKFPDYDFQYDIPVNYFEYKTEIPEFYIYKSILIGKQVVEADHKMENGSQTYENEHNQTSRFSYRQISSFYSAKDIPALQNEPYVDNVDNYKGSLQLELERVRMPDQPVKDYTMTWEGVAKMIFKDDSFGKQLGQSSFLVEDVKRLLEGVEDKKERLNIIFKFVQNKMNWDEKNDYYTDKGVLEAYKSQTGNVAEINFILINMLKLAGIEVSPVLVSTVENGTPVYPTRTGFNYVIAAAEIDGKQILLDATHKFTTPDILPLNVLNWNGRLIKSDGSSQEINLVPTGQSKEFLNIMVKITPSGQLEGKVRTHKSDYEAYRFRVANAGRNTENYLEKLEQQLGDVKISKYSVENIKTNLDKPLLETFDFIADHQTEIIGDKIFVSPMLFFTTTKNPFHQEKRQMPVSLSFPTLEKYNINMEIPEGYAIETLPKPIQMMAENNGITYTFNIAAQDNKIQIICIKEINNSVFAVDQYEGLKEIFQKVIASQNQKIVLKRL